MVVCDGKKVFDKEGRGGEQGQDTNGSWAQKRPAGGHKMRKWINDERTGKVRGCGMKDGQARGGGLVTAASRGANCNNWPGGCRVSVGCAKPDPFVLQSFLFVPGASRGAISNHAASQGGHICIWLIVPRVMWEVGLGTSR